MVQRYREANNGRFPEEPFRKKVVRWLTCGENKYTPEAIAFVAGMKARKVGRGCCSLRLAGSAVAA